MIFKAIKEWFFPRKYLKYQDSVAGLIAYLPVGDLAALVAWINKWIPYHLDVDEAGRPDPLQNYDGGDLTIKRKRGDCESRGAVCSEVIRAWEGWESGHTYFRFTDKLGKVRAHDVCWFRTPVAGMPGSINGWPGGRRGWIEGEVVWGGHKKMIEYYALMGWDIEEIYEVNDIGERI